MGCWWGLHVGRASGRTLRCRGDGCFVFRFLKNLDFPASHKHGADRKLDKVSLKILRMESTCPEARQTVELISSVFQCLDQGWVGTGLFFHNF